MTCRGTTDGVHRFHAGGICSECGIAQSTYERERAAVIGGKVDHPAHYGGANNPYETIKVLEAWLPRDQIIGFLRGNTIKYLSRAGNKNGESMLDDLRKARWYLEREIALREK